MLCDVHNEYTLCFVYVICAVASQCVLVSKLVNTRGSYHSIVTNICDQMQVKLGAELWRVLAPVDAPVSIVNLIVTCSCLRKHQRCG